MASCKRFHPSPYLLLILTMLFWSSNFVLGRAVQGQVPPIALSFWRWTGALMILLPFCWSRLHHQGPLLRRHWATLLLLAVLGVTNFNTFVYLGLQHTTATNAVLMVSTTPVLIVALSFVLLRQTVTGRQLLGILVSLAGVAAIVAKGDPVFLLALDVNRGDAWILLAVMSWAAYSVLLRWRPAEQHPLDFLVTIMALGAVSLAPLYAWELASGVTMAINAPNLITIAYVALFPSVLAFIFWNRAVGELGANRSGQFLHLMPVFGAILSMVFLGERLHGYHLAGIALIALGIWLTTKVEIQRRG